MTAFLVWEPRRLAAAGDFAIHHVGAPSAIEAASAYLGRPVSAEPPDPDRSDAPACRVQDSVKKFDPAKSTPFWLREA